MRKSLFLLFEVVAKLQNGLSKQDPPRQKGVKMEGHACRVRSFVIGLFTIILFTYFHSYFVYGEQVEKQTEQTFEMNKKKFTPEKFKEEKTGAVIVAPQVYPNEGHDGWCDQRTEDFLASVIIEAIARFNIDPDSIKFSESSPRTRYSVFAANP